MSHSSACSNMAENLRYQRKWPFWVFWLHVKNVQKGMFLSDSARSPHRTAKPSRGCLLLAHSRAPPAVILSDRRSPSPMCEFPFGCWGCAGRDDGELVVDPPTPCKIGKHPPAPKKKTACQQGAHGGGHRVAGRGATADELNINPPTSCQ